MSSLAQQPLDTRRPLPGCLLSHSARVYRQKQVFPIERMRRHSQDHCVSEKKGGRKERHAASGEHQPRRAQGACPSLPRARAPCPSPPPWGSRCRHVTPNFFLQPPPALHRPSRLQPHLLPTHAAAAQPAGDCCRLMKERWPQPSGLEGSCFRHEGPGFESQIFHSRAAFPPVKKGPGLASPLRVDREEVCQVVCDRPCSRPRVQSPHTPGWLWGSQRGFGGKACHTEASHRSGGCRLLPKRGPGRGHPCLHTPHQLICGVGWNLDEGPQNGT